MPSKRLHFELQQQQGNVLHARPTCMHNAPGLVNGQPNAGALTSPDWPAWTPFTKIKHAHNNTTEWTDMKSRTLLPSKEKMKKLKKFYAAPAKEIAKAKEAAGSVVSGWRRPTTKRTSRVSAKVRERRVDCVNRRISTNTCFSKLRKANVCVHVWAK